MKKLLAQLKALDITDLKRIQKSEIMTLEDLPESLRTFRLCLTAAFDELHSKQSGMHHRNAIALTEKCMASLPLHEKYQKNMLEKLRLIIDIIDPIKNRNAQHRAEIAEDIQHLLTLYSTIETIIHNPKQLAVVHLDDICAKYQIHLRAVIRNEADQIKEIPHFSKLNADGSHEFEVNFFIEDVAAYARAKKNNEQPFPSHNLRVAMEKYQIIEQLRNTLNNKHPAMANSNLENFRRVFAKNEVKDIFSVHRSDEDALLAKNVGFVLASVVTLGVVALMRNPPWQAKGAVVYKELSQILDEAKKLDDSPPALEMSPR